MKKAKKRKEQKKIKKVHDRIEKLFSVQEQTAEELDSFFADFFAQSDQYEEIAPGVYSVRDENGVEKQAIRALYPSADPKQYVCNAVLEALVKALDIVKYNEGGLGKVNLKLSFDDEVLLRAGSEN